MCMHVEGIKKACLAGHQTTQGRNSLKKSNHLSKGSTEPSEKTWICTAAVFTSQPYILVPLIFKGPSLRRLLFSKRVKLKKKNLSPSFC